MQRTKALIVVTNHGKIGATGKDTGWYLPEVSHVYFPLVEAGFEVDFASPRGGFAPMDPGIGSLSDDPMSERFLKEERAALSKIDTTLAAAAVDPSAYGIVFFAGGHGTMWDFRGSGALQAITAAIWEGGGIVSAVCHGPAALVDVTLGDGSRLVAGRELCSFTDEEERAVGHERNVPFLLETALRERGARFSGAPAWKENVVVSGRLVTGQNPQSAHALGRAIAKLGH